MKLVNCNLVNTQFTYVYETTPTGDSDLRFFMHFCTTNSTCSRIILTPDHTISHDASSTLVLLN